MSAQDYGSYLGMMGLGQPPAPPPTGDPTSPALMPVRLSPSYGRVLHPVPIIRLTPNSPLSYCLQQRDGPYATQPGDYAGDAQQQAHPQPPVVSGLPALLGPGAPFVAPNAPPNPQAAPFVPRGVGVGVGVPHYERPLPPLPQVQQQVRQPAPQARRQA